MFRRLGALGAAVAVAGIGLVGVASGPASASTTLVSCPKGKVHGSGTVNPPVTTTNTTKNVITSDATFTGCSGQEKSGSVHSVTTSRTAGTCANLGSPPPAGTVTGKGTFTITWGDSTTSTGTVTTSSAGPSKPGQTNVLQTITGGKFFLAGHTTKNKATLQLASSEAATCSTTGVDDFTFSNVTASVTSRT